MVMNLNSRLFDRIRVKSTASKPTAAATHTCEHPGCDKPGDHRAPKGRGHENEYWRFCLEHVRAYNQSYNYFNGMSDDAVAAFQKDAVLGHRPTWTMGMNAAARGATRSAGENGKAAGANVEDPFGVFGARAFNQAARQEEAKPKLSKPALQALDTLGLDEGVDAVTIKARYKLLVKRFHPDANGGDRAFEERLQAIIRAYNTLKALGLC
ncbi:Uncharacterized 19.0 kDa protein in cobS 5'region [Hyphomicrobiales bacterium]|jgi:hypothetical protein|nr:Uncharacterized 19.0 kDa protein in cobS 5'region [Hyphomicrobiales bacterium]CAH1684856.1 Uncharacterized 19.0 kDa protein in cobS 5'region [Hyphomicrobiales bacterium]